MNTHRSNTVHVACAALTLVCLIALSGQQAFGSETLAGGTTPSVAILTISLSTNVLSPKIKTALYLVGLLQK